ncbi:Bro-N domain-containing protein [Pseudomonas sp. AO-1]|uniref:BRO-N domain-containing protein n=1 Tax=Pseudomonas sp. AO-1 TaxID=2855434 RepID=UPI001C757D4C|nr:Bro-N domain-containing protein [Pseudomonas sp. AO-1]QXZ14023.1 Bro-N domain-containing protein [Pseudomonas sp. AO-1]
MSMPSIFEFETLPVRIDTGEDGETWFVATDVCRVLEIANPSDAYSRLDDDEKGTRNVRTLGGPQQVVMINEAGLYSLVLSSRKPQAKRFKRWVTHDVLPSLRKTGSYSLSEKLTVNQQISMSKHRLGLVKELMRTRNRTVRDLLGIEITQLSTAMGLPVPDLETIGSVEPPQADLVADFWAALLQLDSKGIAYNHSKDSQLFALNMPHLVELFAANGIQAMVSTEVTNALKRCTEPQFVGMKAVDSTIRKTTTKCWVFKKPTQIRAQ